MLTGATEDSAYSMSAYFMSAFSIPIYITYMMFKFPPKINQLSLNQPTLCSLLHVNLSHISLLHVILLHVSLVHVSILHINLVHVTLYHVYHIYIFQKGIRQVHANPYISAYSHGDTKSAGNGFSVYNFILTQLDEICKNNTIQLPKICF